MQKFNKSKYSWCALSSLKKPQKHLTVSSALSSLACSGRVADYVYQNWLPYN